MQRSPFRIALLLFALLALAPGILPAAADDPATSALLAELDRRAPAGTDRLADILLIEIDALPGAGDLEITYSVDGLPFFAESLEIVAPDGLEGSSDTLVAELLAWHPQVLDNLRGLSAGGALVTASVFRGGTALSTIPLSELAAASRAIQQTVFVPLKTRSTVTYAQGPSRTPVAPQAGLQSISAAAKDPACVQACADEYDYCEWDCDNYGGGAEDCYERCQVNFDSCYNNCPETCTGPTVREYDDTVIVGGTYLGPTRCLIWGFYPYYFDYMRVTYKTTRYRETTQCDGTKTTEVVSVTYTTYDCWLRTWQSCSNPVGDSFYYFTCPS